MSDSLPDGQNRACGDDVAAYALGALDAAEVEQFRRHLETCSICRDELAAFRQVVDILPSGVPPQTASAALRRRTLRAIDREPARGRAAQERSGARGLGRRSGWSMLPRPALAVGAALAVAIIAVAGVELSSSSSPVPTRVIAAQVVGQGTAQLRVSGAGAELVVAHFQAPPAGQIYEVWLQRRRGHKTVLQPTKSLFSVDAQGDDVVDVPGNLHGVSAVMVTPEPDGGSSTPTHAPVITALLS